jgi:hypothetical protein
MGHVSSSHNVVQHGTAPVRVAACAPCVFSTGSLPMVLKGHSRRTHTVLTRLLRQGRVDIFQ